MRSLVPMTGVLGVALLAAVPVAAQQGPPAQINSHREVSNWDFRPNGAFRRFAAAKRAVRREALSRGDVRALNSAAAAPVTGDFKVPVVFLQYSDSAASGLMADTTNFHAVFFSETPLAEAVPRPMSLKTYYEEQSNGNITIDGTFTSWVTTPFTFAFVGAGCGAIRCANGLNRLGQMLDAALDSLNVPARQLDWSQFDSDNDGFVDFVVFVHPTRGAECISQTANNIWAHRYAIAPGGLIGSYYVTQTPWPGHPGQFIRVSDYIIQGAQGGNTACTSAQIMSMGTLAHETGHAFGIPDLYDNSNSAATTEGIGEWSLMSSGNYARPYSPSSFDAWSLAELGWVTVDTLASTLTRQLGPVQTSDTVLVAPIAGSDQFILIENRQGIQSDSAMMGPGFSRQKSPGLLFWLADPSVIAGGTSSNSVNVGPIKGLRLLQADGLRQLDSLPFNAGGNRGDLGDSYPGSSVNRRLTYTSNPSMRTNEGGLAGFVVDSIYQVSANGPMTMRFRKQAPFRVTSTGVAAGALITVNGIGGTAVEEIFALGDSIDLSVADSQAVNSGRTRLTFVSWSDAGARAHTIVSDGTPDTITATLSTSHRVNFTANGSGTIGTSGPATNTFVAQGTPVTLTATPTGGGVFTNWTGDTTSNNAALVLPMGRPFNVTANFTGAVAVTFDQATNAILGVTPLTGPQATYLDAVGNANATYDLGDYLAYIKLNGYIASPQVLQRMTRVLPPTTRKEN